MLTRLQLHRKYDANLEFKNAFVQTFSARLILARSVVLDGYEPPQEFVGSIFLNPTGQELFENLVNSSGCKPHFAKIAVFLDFYFDDLYVACEKSDHVKMLSILSTEAGAMHLVKCT